MHQISLHLAVLWLPRINVDADTAGEPINNWRRNNKRVNCDFQQKKNPAATTAPIPAKFAVSAYSSLNNAIMFCDD